MSQDAKIDIDHVALRGIADHLVLHSFLDVLNAEARDILASRFDAMYATIDHEFTRRPDIGQKVKDLLGSYHDRLVGSDALNAADRHA